MEIGLAYNFGLTIILAKEKEKVLSRLVQGIPGMILIEYENLDDLKSKLKESLSKIK